MSFDVRVGLLCPAATQTPMARKHVLIVEDEVPVRRVLMELAEELGYSVSGVDDGTRALAELALQQPDVILLDLIMPKAEVDGLGFLSRLAGSPAADIPIIVISALGEPLGQEISPEVSSLLRFAAILPKPIPLDALAEALDQLLGPGSPS